MYWLTIYSKVIGNYENNTLGWLHQHLVHIFPCAAVLVIFLTTDIKIKASHSKCFPVIALLFGVVNCYHVKKSGVPTYWFLTWEDHNSPLVILGITVIAITFFVSLAKLSNYLKRAKKVIASLEHEMTRDPTIKIKRKRNCT